MEFFIFILLLLAVGVVAILLFNRAAKLKEELRQAAVELSTAKERIEHIRRELDTANELSRKTTQELDTAKGYVDQARREADTANELSRKTAQELHERIRQTTEELSGTKGRLERYASIQNIEAAIATTRDVANAMEAQLKTLKQEKARLREELASMKKEQELYQLNAQLREFGIYEPTFKFDDSSAYKAALDKNYSRQKEMIQEERAAKCTTTWSVEGDFRKGRKMTEQYLKLMLWAFNGECDALISKVRYDNAVKVEERIQKLYERINKLGQEKKCALDYDYLLLKLQELALVHEYNEKKRQEADEQRMIREQMRDEDKAHRELERAQQEAEREAERYEKALEKAQRDTEKAHGEKLTKLQGEIERINQLLSEANARKERAISQAQQTKSGWVYVISNVGSFGEQVYKIGMTRRQDPMERVYELGDASVPFPFDVHARIPSDDAPKLEKILHKTFEHRRVNLVNMRKEFFAVSLEEIREVVLKHHGEIQFTLIAEAEEYRKTQMMRSGKPREGVAAQEFLRG